MKIALLGGKTGFVGRNVAEVLQKKGFDFVNASRSSGVDFASVTKATVFFKKEQPDVIINCIAHVGSLNYVTTQAADIITDNSKIALTLYEAIVKASIAPLVINPIANCAYPARAETFIEDNWWDGHLHRSVLSYGTTRRLLWSIAECYNMQYGIRSIHLLVPNMYGPYDSTNPDKAHALNALISKFLKAKKSRQDKVMIWGTGVAIREWLYASDFGKIIVDILHAPGRLGLTEPLNIAQNFGLSVRELVGLIQKATHYEGKIEYDSSMPDGAYKKVMDDRKFKKVFPDFRFTNLKEGIDSTIKYYESIYPY